jgi:hypothetical protein
VHEKTTVIVVGVDAKSPEELESERLREYAQASGPAGVTMSSEVPEAQDIVEFVKAQGAGALREMDEALFKFPQRYKREPSLAMEQAGMDPKPAAGGGFTVAMPGGGPLESEYIDSGLLEHVVWDEDEPSVVHGGPSVSGTGRSLSDAEIDHAVRSSRGETMIPVGPRGPDVHGRTPDMVLMDWMGPETGRVSSMFLEPSGPQEAEIPESVAEMRRDLLDYGRFGGDPLSIELVRQDDAGRDMVDVDDNAMLRELMAENVGYDKVMGAREALSAVREDLGRNVQVELEQISGTTTTFSAYSPRIGRVRYAYDSVSGNGRILGSK